MPSRNALRSGDDRTRRDSVSRALRGHAPISIAVAKRGSRDIGERLLTTAQVNRLEWFRIYPLGDAAAGRVSLA